MLNSINYEYNFEIETILQQFIAIIDNAIVMRYSINKESRERELDEIIKPGYILGTKQRVMLDIINKAKNYELPAVIITLNGISFSKERLTAKNQNRMVASTNTHTAYPMPTPITLKVEVNILTKYMTDLYQIYGKLASQFQPALAFSWFVPQNMESNWVELRNKIEWDGDLTLDVRTEAKASDEDKFSGKMTFNIDGWIFPEMNKCVKTITDIGTSIVPNEEALTRIYDEISIFRPLVHSVLNGDSWKKYNNPREIATAHPLITSIYRSQSFNNKEFFYIIDKGRAESMLLTPASNIIINGYNLKNAKVLAIPLSKRDIINGVDLISKTYENNLHPFPNSLEEKHNNISGYPLNITKHTDNQIIVNFNKPLTISGNFDLAVVNDIDYDMLSKRKGFVLKA